jgi:hypothetical protein
VLALKTAIRRAIGQKAGGTVLVRLDEGVS